MTERGPHLQAALFCEKVIEDKQGVLSAIAIIDRVIVKVEGTDSEIEEALKQQEVECTALITFKSGAARGSSTVTLIAEQPSGLRRTAARLPVFFEGEDRGTNLIVNLKLPAEREGIYWFDVQLDGQLITRMSIRIIHRRASVQESDAP